MELRMGYELDKYFLLKIRVVINQVVEDAGMSLKSGLIQGGLWKFMQFKLKA